MPAAIYSDRCLNLERLKATLSRHCAVGECRKRIAENAWFCVLAITRPHVAISST